ncbi:MAG: DUF1579 family protein [Pseudomonadota bacterium]
MKQILLGLSLTALATLAIAGHHETDEAAMAMPSEADIMAAMSAASTPGAPHKKLADSVGTFNAEMMMYMGPGAEPEAMQMTVERHLELGGRVLVENWKGSAMGQPFEGVGRTGYDNVTGKYWTTWNDTFSTGVLTMEGQWDAEIDGIVWTGEAVNPMTKQTYTSRSVATYPSEDTEEMKMYENHGEGEYLSMTFKLTRE